MTVCWYQHNGAGAAHPITACLPCHPKFVLPSTSLEEPPLVAEYSATQRHCVQIDGNASGWEGGVLTSSCSDESMSLRPFIAPLEELKGTVCWGAPPLPEITGLQCTGKKTDLFIHGRESRKREVTGGKGWRHSVYQSRLGANSCCD